MKRYSKKQILDSVLILDVAKRSSIPLEPISSGNFTHRCKCPSPEHKAGSERTGSLYIDGENNNFYCFGCGASNNVIDFYILKNNCDFSQAISELSEFVDPAKVGSSQPFSKKKSNFSILFHISEMFRRYQKNHPEDDEWVSSLMKKTDEYIDEIDRYDLKKTKSLAARVRDILNRRSI